MFEIWSGIAICGVTHCIHVEKRYNSDSIITARMVSILNPTVSSAPSLVERARRLDSVEPDQMVQKVVVETPLVRAMLMRRLSLV
jgi:hypothetical protein